MVLEGSSPAELMETATQTVQDIQRALNEGILEDLRASMAQIRRITENVNEGSGTVSRLLKEDQLYEDIEQIVANVRTISTAVASGEGTLGKLLSEDEQIYQDLAATVAQIRTLAESIGRGEGSVGKLLTDDELYHQIQALMREGRATLDDLRETSPVTTFTSIFFGAF